MHDCAMRTRAENAQKENPKTFALKLLINKVALQKITVTSRIAQDAKRFAIWSTAAKKHKAK